MRTDNYPELLVDLRSTLTASLVAEGIDAGRAGQISHAAAEQIRNEWGGAMVYIPKGLDFELTARDLEIWAKFTGKNHRQLCRDYDVTIQWLYKIIKCQRAADVKRRQNDLFG